MNEMTMAAISSMVPMSWARHEKVNEITSKDLWTATKIGDEMHASLNGHAESLSKPALDLYLRSLDEVARSRSIGLVIIDLRELEFLNSSCFKAFVVWLGILEEIPGPQQYRVQFIVTRKRHWQSRSLGALACFAPDLVEVTAAA